MEDMPDAEGNTQIKDQDTDQLVGQDHRYILVHFQPGQTHFSDAARSYGQKRRNRGEIS